MFREHRSQNIQSIKVKIVPVASLVELTLHPVRFEARTWLKVLLVPLRLASQKASGERIEAVKRHAVVS